MSATVTFAPTGADLSVDFGELARLLGYPARRPLEGDVLRGAKEAQAWFAQHGRPWGCTRRAAITAVATDSVALDDGTRLRSVGLAERCRRGDAVAVVAAVVSAGAAVDAETAQRWSADRPDEAYFLDRFAVAVVEHLAGWVAGRIAGQAAAESLGVLVSSSPGYDGWELGEQRNLADLVAAGLCEGFPGPLEVLDSGMIAPKSSLLAVFPLAPRQDLAAAEQGRSKCYWCALSACGFRRARFAGSGQAA